MKIKYDDQFYWMMRLIEDISVEWTSDYEYLDAVITINTEMLLNEVIQEKFGFTHVIDEGDAIKCDQGYFYKLDDGKTTWLWAIARRPITEKSTARQTFGSFYLTDSESAGHIPNTKIWQEFKQRLEPYLNAVMLEELENLSRTNMKCNYREEVK